MDTEHELKEIIVAQKKILDTLENLREFNPDRPANFGEWLSDILVTFIGSWRFIVLQIMVLGAWIVFNTVAFFQGVRFDSYPYILLNLTLSFQAAFASPMILMAQNRVEQKDRIRAIDAYNTVIKIEKMLEELRCKLSKNGIGTLEDKGECD